MARGSSKTLYGRKTPAEVRAAIQDICEKENYDPFMELIRLATETVETEIDGRTVSIPIATVAQKIEIAKEVASFLAPKVKNIEVKGEINGEFKFKLINQSVPIAQTCPPEKLKQRQGAQLTFTTPKETSEIVEAEVTNE